jgi:anti-sigma B factor antagonist
MALELRTVTVRQLPGSINREQEWAFLEEIKMSLYVERPRIVLNCSRLRVFDPSSLQLLLCCLEEAMKRNGDVRLSSVTEPARAMLESVGIGKLFKIYDSDNEAVKSFQRPRVAMPLGVANAIGSMDAEVELESCVLQSSEDAA